MFVKTDLCVATVLSFPLLERASILIQLHRAFVFTIYLQPGCSHHLIHHKIKKSLTIIYECDGVSELSFTNMFGVQNRFVNN